MESVPLCKWQVKIDPVRRSYFDPPGGRNFMQTSS
jgi:hypothetical protein